MIYTASGGNVVGQYTFTLDYYLDYYCALHSLERNYRQIAALKSYLCKTPYLWRLKERFWRKFVRKLRTGDCLFLYGLYFIKNITYVSAVNNNNSKSTAQYKRWSHSITHWQSVTLMRGQEGREGREDVSRATNEFPLAPVSLGLSYGREQKGGFIQSFLWLTEASWL